MRGPLVLVIDDVPGVRDLVSEILIREGAEVLQARSADEGLEIMKREPVDVLFADLRLPGKSGLELLDELKRVPSNVATVIFTGHGTVDSAVEAMRHGACDFVTKPLTIESVSRALRRAIQAKQSKATSPAESGSTSYGETIIAQSSAMREVLRSVAHVAATETAVLIEGESGVGKDLVARRIHQLSKRGSKPFVPINCHLIDSQLIEAEIFGDSAQMDQAWKGKLEQAHGGTLYLEGVENLPNSSQQRLFYTLKERSLQRLSGRKPVPIDVRIISATTCRLQDRVSEGQLSPKLYHFLHVYPITIPPLRDRVDDVLPLAYHFLRKFTTTPSPSQRFSKAACEVLTKYSWPGNCHELSEVAERSVLFSTGETVEVRELDDPEAVIPIAANGEVITIPIAGKSLREITCDVVREVVERCNGNKAEAARVLKMHRRTLYRMLEAAS